VNETCLIRFKSCATPSCPLFGVRDNRILDGLCILCGVIPDSPCVEVVDEPECPSGSIDLPLDQVGVIKDVEER
jgi:hypothetical protein